jgi:hypothetical protein
MRGLANREGLRVRLRSGAFLQATHNGLLAYIGNVLSLALRESISCWSASMPSSTPQNLAPNGVNRYSTRGGISG